MRYRLSRSAAGAASIALSLALTSLPATAQQSRSVDGQIIGTATWQTISVSESAFRGEALDTFAVAQKKLPDRIQESWRDQRNLNNGPLITMFYERLHTQYFSEDSLDRDFRTILSNQFKTRGVSVDDIEIVRVARAFKGADVAYGATRCFVAIRLMGDSSFEAPGFTGNENLRVFVCQKNSAERQNLKATALALVSELERDGKRLRTPGRSPGSYQALSGKLFAEASQIAPAHSDAKRAEGNWQRRPIAIEWGGETRPVAGEISFREKDRNGVINMTLPGDGASCEGTYSFGPGRSGSWAVACTNGVTATGTFQAFGSGNGSEGTGVDNKGNVVRFTIGGA